MTERLTEELLDELLEAPSIDAYVEKCEPEARSLSTYLQQLLEEKHLKRSQVVRMANLNETYGYQIFTGRRKPARDKVLQIAFIFCLDRGCSLQKVNEELYRFGEETVC